MTSFHLFYFYISQLAKQTDFLDYLSFPPPPPPLRIPEEHNSAKRPSSEFSHFFWLVEPSAGGPSECVVSICTNAFYLL